MNAPRCQKGLSLIELMVSITVGVLVLGIGLSVLATTLNSNSSSLRYARFNQDLRGVLNAVTHDLERAGTWGLAAEVVQRSSQTDLEFSAASGDVTVTALARGTTTTNQAFAAPLANALVGRTLVLLVPINGVNQRFDMEIESVDDDNTISGELTAVDPPDSAYESLPSTLVRASSWTILNPFGLIEVNDAAMTGSDCIRYSYDLDLDGVLDANEYFGFRYDATNKAVQARTSDGECSESGWESVTDPDMIEISQFALTAIHASGEKNELTVDMREYVLQLGGDLKAETGVERSVQAAVKVRNNRVN